MRSSLLTPIACVLFTGSGLAPVHLSSDSNTKRSLMATMTAEAVTPSHTSAGLLWLKPEILARYTPDLAPSTDG